VQRLSYSLFPIVWLVVGLIVAGNRQYFH